MGWAMNPVSVLKIRTVDPSSSDRESHNQDNPGCRPISLLSFLEAENVRLHQAVVELSLDARALGEALKGMEAPTTSLGHTYFGLPARVRGRRNCDGLTTTLIPFHVTNDSDDSNTSIATCGARRCRNHRTPVQHCSLHSSCYCGLPRIELAPELVLFGILPPLIYSAGVAMSWREFRFNLRPIVLLAFG